MNKAIIIFAATVSTITASPVLADDAGMDSASMVEQVNPRSIDAVTPVVTSFNIASLGIQSTSGFMATDPKSFEQGYRLKTTNGGFESQPSVGLVSLFVPKEFAYRSNAQDTGVDAALPGRFLASSTRSDFISQSGPENRGKTSLGIRLGF
ncbi:MAG: hypothetical protein ABJN65_15955 [Parasphingorhabdus sp.]